MRSAPTTTVILASLGLLAAGLTGTSTAQATDMAPTSSRAPVRVGVEARSVPMPTDVSTIPVTRKSHPFNGTRYNKTPLDLRTVGYREDEYQIGGTADVYAWGDGDMLQSLDSGQYATRILVRRPAQAADFSGNVVVELLNPTSLHDLDIVWAAAQEHLIDSGDAWVGVTVKPSSLTSLKKYDASRYGDLSMANPDPGRCATTTWSGASAGTENGLVWDMISQIGTLLRSRDPANPLATLPVRAQLLTGYSQTAGYLTTYLNAIAPLVDGGTGPPIYDGYLPFAGANFPVPLNQCDPVPKPGSSRWVINPVGDAPVIALQTLSDFYALNGFASRRPDSTTPGDNYRLYEVAGAGHVWQKQVEYTPSGDELVRSGFTADWWDPYCAQDVTDFPLHYAIDAALSNMVDWVRKGTPAPSAPRIEVTDPSLPTASARTDRFGNVLGGLRLPAIDAPRASYYGTTPGTGTCKALWGHAVPLASYALDGLYPERNDYVEAVSKSVALANSNGWLTDADSRAVLREARHYSGGRD